MGTAAAARIERIAAVTISSTSVSPRSPRLTIRIDFALPINASLNGLLHLNLDLRSRGRQLLLRTVDRAGARDCNDTIPDSFALEGKNADHARSAHPCRSRRT